MTILTVPFTQGWQYGTVRSTLNRTVPAYRTSVQFLKRTLPTYRTRNITKQAYLTSVPYFLAKIEAYRTYVPYRTAILALNYSQLQLSSKLLTYKSAISIHIFSVRRLLYVVFCLCIEKAGEMCKKSGIFESLRIQLKCRSCFISHFFPIHDMPRVDVARIFDGGQTTNQMQWRHQKLRKTNFLKGQKYRRMEDQKPWPGFGT